MGYLGGFDPTSRLVIHNQTPQLQNKHLPTDTILLQDSRILQLITIYFAMSSGSRDQRSGDEPLDLGSPELERPRGSSPEKQIAVALYRRPPYSGDPESRKWLQHETYHWGILIISPHRYDAYDATDRNDLDPVTMRYENPGGHWWFRHQEDVDPRKSGKCLGHIVIGSIPSDVDVRDMLEEVPLPERNRNPQQSCVTWVGNAIRLCRSNKYVDDFDVGMFLDWAMRFGDRMMTCDPRDVESQVAFYNRRTEEKQKQGIMEAKEVNNSLTEA